MTDVLCPARMSMYAAASTFEPTSVQPALQRARGEVSVSFRRSADGRTHVGNLFQQGCLKARLPRPQCDRDADLVLINIAGGVTGGDRLSVKVTVGEGARATVTTPGCERVYRAVDAGEVLIEQQLRVRKRARLDWLPQETILFDGSRMRRRLDVQLEAGAEITIAETVLFGRTAMGETMRGGFFSERWMISRDAKLLFADAIRIAEAFEAITGCSTTLRSNTATATLLHVGRDAALKRDALRAHFAESADTIAGASIVADVLLAKIVASSGSALRRVLIPALACVRDPRPLPRLWSC